MKWIIRAVHKNLSLKIMKRAIQIETAALLRYKFCHKFSKHLSKNKTVSKYHSSHTQKNNNYQTNKKGDGYLHKIEKAQKSSTRQI